MNFNNSDLYFIIFRIVPIIIYFILSDKLIKEYAQIRDPDNKRNLKSYLSTVSIILAAITAFNPFVMFLILLIFKGNMKNAVPYTEEKNNEVPAEAIANENRQIVTMSNFDNKFTLSEDDLLKITINEELKKASIPLNNDLIPETVLKKQKIFNILQSLLLFIFITLIFFHLPIYMYLIGLIIIVVFGKRTSNYDITSYIAKEIKGRPDEKISNIVMSVKTSLVNNNLHKLKLILFSIATILPLIFFIKPRIMYEKLDNAYGVRWYAFGITNFSTAQIPSTHKGKPVVSLRGNTFSDMFFLREVVLPESITEIRGQAFKNDYNLEKVNIPSKLTYLGGSAFKNCKKIKYISLPDTLTEMGGEVFSGASSLESIKLSENLTEIRGNSFENTALKTVNIPDKVTRIAARSFYNVLPLTNVQISPNSKLNEIGSSAFRKCPKLKSIIIPKNTSVNIRSFKESPTTVQRYGETYAE